jgi:hypothetical protein
VLFSLFTTLGKISVTVVPGLLIPQIVFKFTHPQVEKKYAQHQSYKKGMGIMSSLIK